MGSVPSFGISDLSSTMFSLLFLSLLSAVNALPQASYPAENAPNVTILTSFFGYDGCSTGEGEQKDQIIQAQQDANMLAAKALNINWGSDPAAIDYFGPPDETEKGDIRQQVTSTSGDFDFQCDSF